MKTQTRHSLMLMLCAFIWGTAFVAQSAGSGMGAYSFLAGRSWLAVLVLIPTVFAFDAVRKKQGQPYGWPKEKSERKTLLAAGLVCGTFLFAASAAQQIGITINPSTAKAAFLTAMYVVLVPVFGLFLGRKGSAQLWVSMVIAVAGLYMLCMKNGFGGIETSDWILLSCAVLFSFQIMSIDHFSPLVDGVRLSLIQFIVVAVESSAAALIFETPTLAEYGANLLPVVYCGVMSSGAGYTLQILGQKELNPAIASLIMCLESVFSALGGWLLLGQNLSMRESAGCALIFAAVVLSQLPLAELRRCKRARDAASAGGIPYELTRGRVKRLQPPRPAGRHRGPQHPPAHDAGSRRRLRHRRGGVDTGRAGPAGCPRKAAGGAARQGDRPGPLHGHERQGLPGLCRGAGRAEAHHQSAQHDQPLGRLPHGEAPDLLAPSSTICPRRHRSMW